MAFFSLFYFGYDFICFVEFRIDNNYFLGSFSHFPRAPKELFLNGVQRGLYFIEVHRKQGLIFLTSVQLEVKPSSIDDFMVLVFYINVLRDKKRQVCIFLTSGILDVHHLHFKMALVMCDLLGCS